jgi:uncharacterized protein YoaH (UPF0181 family)
MAEPRLWHELQKKESGPALLALAKRHRDRAKARRERATNLLCQYSGLALSDFAASAYDNAEELELERDSVSGERSRYTITWNLAASLIDTVDSKVFTTKTKTQFVVTDGGWQVKRAAVLGARFVEGQMHEEQGIFPDLWALWRHAARLAITATTAAAVFFFADPDDGKVIAELDDTLNLFIETSGLPYDGIASVARITYWSPDRLAARYPQLRDQIYLAAEKPSGPLSGVSDLTQDEFPADELKRVPVAQGWRVQQGGGKKNGGVDGVFCMAIQGALLEHKPYKSTELPCVIFCPLRQLAGVWGHTVLERIMAPHRRLNEILASVDDAERLTPKGVVFYDPTVTDEKLIAKIENVQMVPFTGPMDRRPVYEPPPPFHPLILELLDRHKAAIFDLTGISEANVTASREKGLSSGVAIRLVQNQGYERLSAIDEEFSRCVGPATAKQIIRCAQELRAAGAEFKSLWKGGGENGFLREIDSDVFDILTKHKYRAEAEAVSGTANTPADRLELAEELMQAGIITGEAYAAILQHYDVPGAVGSQLSSAEEQYVERQIDNWLYSELDEAHGQYMGPEKWMNTPALLLKVGAAYVDAKMGMIHDMQDPEVTARLGLFFRFMSQLEAQIKEKEERAAALQAMAQGQQQPAQLPAAPAAQQAPPVAA